MSDNGVVSPKPPAIHGQSFGLEVAGDLVTLWVEDDGLWYQQDFMFDKHWTRELIGLLKKVER